MRIYLSHPGSRLAAHLASEMPVLISFANLSTWMIDYLPTYSSLLFDSGAYSELNGNATVDLGAYREFSGKWIDRAAAIAGLDDISGDWRRSLKNYEAIPWSFPTFHDTDPPELLPDLIAMAQERGTWIGIGLEPPREKREKWIRETLEKIPDGLHVHGWALRRYSYMSRFDSMDSTSWFRKAFGLKAMAPLAHLTDAECLEIVVKRFERWTPPDRDQSEDGQMDLFREATREE